MAPTAIVAEDEPMLRAQLRTRLGEAWPELHIVAEAANGDEALAAIDAHSPDIAFLDIRMPVASGLDVAQRVGDRCHVVFVTAYDEYAIAAFEQGAVDYVLKPPSPERIAKLVARLKSRLAAAPLDLSALIAKLASGNYVVIPFDQIFQTVRSGAADVGLLIHEGQLTWQKEGLQVCADLGAWWSGDNGGLPLPLGGNVIHKRFDPALRKAISDILTASINYSLAHRAEAVQHALQYARDMGRDLADKFVGMYVNHWTLDYGEKGRESIRRFLGRALDRGLIPHRQELEFVA